MCKLFVLSAAHDNEGVCRDVTAALNDAARRGLAVKATAAQQPREGSAAEMIAPWQDIRLARFDPDQVPIDPTVVELILDDGRRRSVKT